VVVLLYHLCEKVLEGGRLAGVADSRVEYVIGIDTRYAIRDTEIPIRCDIAYRLALLSVQPGYS
jgi:hypothetical protein